MPTVGFLHTSTVHVPTFEALVAEIAPGTTVVDDVAQQLLEIARESGVADERVVAGIGQRLDGLIGRGAALVVCTCSTIGAVAESVGRQRGIPVVRVDRPMAELAVDVGGRIAVVAALESTLVPTSELLDSVAADRGVDVDLDMHVVADAWELFESGDQAGYLDAISDDLAALAGVCDVIVLAQASMAGAADLVDVDVPVLSSPRSAMRTLLTSTWSGRFTGDSSDTVG